MRHDATTWLARFVEDVRVIVPIDEREPQIRRLPDGRTTVVVRALQGGRGGVSVVGPHTRALFKTATGITRAVILQIKPGWAVSLLGVAASTLTDRIVPLEQIWGRPGAELGVEVLAARSVADTVERLARAFAARAQLTFESSSARLARRAVRLLEHDEVRVDSVAKRLGVTARHLRRAFTDSIGIGPKDFARTVRLQRAVQSAASSTSWGRIAADAGYYDQAHLIAEFRDLVGVTPGAYFGPASPIRLPSGSVK